MPFWKKHVGTTSPLDLVVWVVSRSKKISPATLDVAGNETQLNATPWNWILHASDNIDSLHPGRYEVSRYFLI